MSGRARVLLSAAGVFLLARLLWLVALLVVTRDGPRSAHSILTRWDAQWYARIATDGYGHVIISPTRARHSDYAFFPLLPLLERAGHAMTGLAPADVGLIVSWISGAVAAAGICALGIHLGSQRIGFVWATLWSLLPMSAVLALSYSDSLLAALCAWGLLALLQRRWLTAGLLAAAAGLARPTGAGLVVAAVAMSIVAIAHRRDWRAGITVVLAPLGLVGYLAWVGLRTGSAAGYFDVTNGWRNGLDGGASFARWVAALSPPAAAGVIVGVVVLLGLLVLLVRDREPWPLILYTAVIVAMSLTTSGFFGSKPRYLLAAFPVLLPVARRLSRLRTPAISVSLIVLGLIGTTYGVVWLTGSGPP